MTIPPKKSLGQHFLYNPSTIDKIMNAASVGPDDQILEIGPGPGVMTEKLALRARKLVAIEKDHRFARELTEKLASFGNVTILEADILETNLKSVLKEGPWKVVANLPYNVATVIVAHLLADRELFSSLHLMFQKEVAERIVAKPGSKSFGTLSIMSQLYSENKIMFRLPPGAFTPPPKVDSAVVQFLICKEPRYPVQNVALLRSIVQAAFSKRRKMIRNALKGGLNPWPEKALDEALDASQIDPATRPEDLPIEKFVEVANALSLRYGCP